MKLKRTVEPSNLDEAIDSAIFELKGHTADTEAYKAIVEQITALNAVRETRTNRFSKDTLVLAAANFAGIAMIVGHERAHLVTSKALSLVGKFK